MDDDRFAWVRQTDEVLDSDHPDYAALIELDHVERWIGQGAPPPDDEPPPMPRQPRAVDVPDVALAVSRQQAAVLLGVSPDSFERHVLPDLKVVPIGSRQYITVRELERWLSEREARALKGRR